MCWSIQTTPLRICSSYITKLPLFLKWSIRFEKPFEVEERATRKVHYADRFELEQEILQRGCAYDEDDFAQFHRERYMSL